MLKPAFTPDTITKATYKMALGKTIKALRKMANFHKTSETACSFYLNLEYDFNPQNPDKQLLLLAGKMGKWKNIVKQDVAKNPMQTLRGAAYMRLAQDGITPEALVLMPVKGKAKEVPCTKALRPIAKKLKIEIEFVKGMSEEALELLEAQEDAAPDVDELEEDDAGLEAEMTDLLEEVSNSFDDTELKLLYQALFKQVKIAQPLFNKSPQEHEREQYVAIMKALLAQRDLFQEELAKDIPQIEKDKYAPFLTNTKPLYDYAEKLITWAESMKAKATRRKPELSPALLKAYDAIKEGKFDDNWSKKKQACEQLIKALEAFEKQVNESAQNQADKDEAQEALDQSRDIRQDLATRITQMGNKVPNVLSSLETVKGIGGSAHLLSPGYYGKILDLMAQYESPNIANDYLAKTALITEIDRNIKLWFETNKPPYSSGNQKEANALNQLKLSLEEQKKYLLKGVDRTITKADYEALLYEHKAGTSAASKQAQEIASATTDNRAIALARIISDGGGNDKTFGQIMKWLRDDAEGNLEALYLDAKLQLTGKVGRLRMDIATLFGASSLQTLFLLNQLDNKQSPFADMAIAYGLLGTGWFNSGEISDVVAYVHKNLNAKELNLVINPDGKDRFASEIHAKLVKDKELFQELKSLMLTKEVADGSISEEAALNNINESTKLKYKSTDDYYLHASFKRVGNNASTFLEVVRDWVKTSTPERRAKVLNPKSQFMLHLSDKTTGVLVPWGLSKSEAASIKAVIECYSEPIAGQEGVKAVEELQQLAKAQAEKTSYRRWKDNEVIGDEMNKILFAKNIKDPQLAIIQKFFPSDVEAWQQGDATKKAEILEKAKLELKKVLVQADMKQEKMDEILQRVDAAGTKGDTYFAVKSLADEKIGFRAASRAMELIDGLDPDSKEIIGLRYDIALLRKLRAQVIGTVAKGKGLAKWKVTMSKLGLPPSATEIEAAKQAHEADTQNQDLKDQYDLLLELKKFAESETLSDEELGANLDQARVAQLSQHKMLSKDQVEKLKIDLSNQPSYWAAKLAKEYKASDNDHTLVMLAAQTQIQATKQDNQGTFLAQVMEEIKRLSSSLHEKINQGSGKTDRGNSYDLIKKALVAGQSIKIAELVQHAREDTFTAYRVPLKDLQQITKGLSSDQLLDECFDFKPIKTALDNKADLLGQLDAAATEEDKQALQTQIAQADAEIAKAFTTFDLKPEFLDQLDDSARGSRILAFKNELRNKVADAAGDEAKAKKLLEVFKKNGITTLTEADILLIGQNVKGLATLERNIGLESGLQWSSQSSTMLQRDAAGSKYLKEAWGNQEKLAKSQSLSPEEASKEKLDMAARLASAQEDFAAAQQRFEETKAKYDNRLKKAVSIIVGSILFAATVLTGVGGAGFLLQLVWQLSSTAVTVLINETVNKIAAGTNYDGYQQFLASALTQLTKDSLTFLAGQALYALKYDDFTSAINQGLGGEGAVGKFLVAPAVDVLAQTPKAFVKAFAENLTKGFSDKDKGLLASPGDLAKSIGNIFTDMPFDYLKGICTTAFGEAAQGLSKLIDPNDKKLFSYDKKFGKDKDNNAQADGPFQDYGRYAAEATNASELISSLKQNIRSGRVWINIANGIAYGKADKSVSIEALIENQVDKVIEAFQQSNPEAGPIDLSTFKEDIEAGKQAAQTELRNKLAQIIGSDVPANFNSLSFEELQEIHLSIPQKHELQAVQYYLSTIVPASRLTLQAYTIAADIANKKRSLQDYGVEFARLKTQFSDENYAQDWVSGKIRQTYPVPDGQNGNIDLSQNLEDIYENWKAIQLLLPSN